MRNMNCKIKLILAERSDSGSWTQISWFKCENLSLCSQVTGSLESCCPLDTSQVKMALFGTACSTGDTRWPSDLHASPLWACEPVTAGQTAKNGHQREVAAAGQCWNWDYTWICVWAFFCFDWTGFWHQVCTLLWPLCGRTSREEHAKPQHTRCLFMQCFYCHI